MDATSGAAAVWWSIGIAALFLVVAPLAVYLAQRVLQHILEIRGYANDLLEHGAATAGNLDPVPALVDTQQLVRSVGGGLQQYGGSLARIL